MFCSSSVAWHYLASNWRIRKSAYSLIINVYIMTTLLCFMKVSIKWQVYPQHIDCQTRPRLNLPPSSNLSSWLVPQSHAVFLQYNPSSGFQSACKPIPQRLPRKKTPQARGGSVTSWVCLREVRKVGGRWLVSTSLECSSVLHSCLSCLAWVVWPCDSVAVIYLSMYLRESHISHFYLSQIKV